MRLFGAIVRFCEIIHVSHVFQKERRRARIGGTENDHRRVSDEVALTVRSLFVEADTQRVGSNGRSTSHRPVRSRTIARRANSTQNESGRRAGGDGFGFTTTTTKMTTATNSSCAGALPGRARPRRAPPPARRDGGRAHGARRVGGGLVRFLLRTERERLIGSPNRSLHSYELSCSSIPNQRPEVAALVTKHRMNHA